MPIPREKGVLVSEVMSVLNKKYNYPPTSMYTDVNARDMHVVEIK